MFCELVLAYRLIFCWPVFFFFKSKLLVVMEQVCLCVHCGTPNEALYRVFAQSALTLETCKNCGKIVDKYIEYDLTAIFIDILLLKISAYRHVLFNTVRKAYLGRLLALTILSTAYVEWVYKKHLSNVQEPIFYELEWGYYLICIQHLINVSVFTLTFLLFSFLATKSVKVSSYFSYKSVIQGIALSYCWNLVVIPSLVWNHYVTYSLLSQMALFTSCIHTFRVCIHPDYRYAIGTVLCAYVMQWSVSRCLQISSVFSA